MKNTILAAAILGVLTFGSTDGSTNGAHSPPNVAVINCGDVGGPPKTYHVVDELPGFLANHTTAESALAHALEILQKRLDALVNERVDVRCRRECFPGIGGTGLAYACKLGAKEEPWIAGILFGASTVWDPIDERNYWSWWINGTFKDVAPECDDCPPILVVTGT